MDVTLVAALVAVVLVLAAVLKSVHRIGPAEVGLVIKNLGFKKLHDDDPIAFGGEAGYQAELLMPGLRFRFWPVFSVSRFPWVQVPAGETGVVIAQVGQPLPIGNKSAVYKPEFGNFSDVADFISNGGEKGVQRPVLPPGTLVPIHPVAFVVVTSRGVFGLPVSPELATLGRGGTLAPQSFGLTPEQLRVVVIAPQGDSDVIGLVTTLEGAPLDKGDIASRLGSFDDVAALEEGDAGVTDAELIDMLLGSKNVVHNNYQDFQAFIDAGGRIGLQHDPLLYGAYLLNPFLVRVELVPMLVVNQGEVAVIKGFVGQVSVDISANQAQAREQEATGEAAYVRLTGQAEADPTQAIGLAEAKATEALGLAKATGFEAQREAIGELATAAVAVAGAIADGQIDIMPEVLVTGGGGALDGLAATLMRTLRAGTPVVSVPDAVEAEAIVEEVDEELSAPEPKPVA